MTWYFVLYVLSSDYAGIDPGITGYSRPSQRVEIQVPSEAVCKQLVVLNPNTGAECIAKPGILK